MRTIRTFFKGLLLAGIAAATLLSLNACSKDEGKTVKKHKVEFSPAKPPGLVPFPPSKDTRYYVTATVDGKEINSGDEVAEGKEVTFTAYTGLMSLMKLDKWEITGAETLAVVPETIVIKVKGTLKVVAVFKKKTSTP